MRLTRLLRLSLAPFAAGLGLGGLPAASPLLAQNTTGTIRGAITAAAKAVAGAEIIAKNVASGVARSTTSR